MSYAATVASEPQPTPSIRWFTDIGLDDLDQVGGKNSSLGEMISHLTASGVHVPDGFATTAEAYRRFLGSTGRTRRISEQLDALDVDDVAELARVGQLIRTRLMIQAFPPDLEDEIRAAYQQLCGEAGDIAVAVRSRTGDRVDVGLQVQRVRQPAGRRPLRTPRREPDDRLPGPPPATSPPASPTASPWNAKRCGSSATTWA